MTCPTNQNGVWWDTVEVKIYKSRSPVITKAKSAITARTNDCL